MTRKIEKTVEFLLAQASPGKFAVDLKSTLETPTTTGHTAFSQATIHSEVLAHSFSNRISKLNTIDCLFQGTFRRTLAYVARIVGPEFLKF